MGVHCDHQIAHYMLIERCAMYTVDKSCFMLRNACSQATKPILNSPKVLELIFHELAQLLYSPEDAVIFDDDRFDRTFKFLHQLWIGIETYVPQFWVPDPPVRSLKRSKVQLELT